MPTNFLELKSGGCFPCSIILKEHYDTFVSEMKNPRIIFVLLGILVFSSISAQTSNDTALKPYWTEMMKAPDANYYKVKRAFDLYWKDSVPARGHGYKVFKRWEWRVRDKMLPDGSIQWNRGSLNETGFNSGQSNNQQGLMGMAAPCPATGRWTAVGPQKHPYNQSGQPTGVGRINGFAFHPTDSNVVFALAPQGGVWKTTDNGLTWLHLFGKNPVVNTIGASSMLLSYNNPDTMYIGTGDRDAGDAPGMGVVWSTNGGITWSARNSGIGTLTVGKMVMHPKNSAIIIIATNGGIYRTTNSGLTWTFIISGNYTDIVMHPNNPNLIYATRNGLFFRSTNNGQSFVQITAGLPTGSSRGQIAVSKANRAYVYFVTTPSVNFQGLYRSADSGLTFTTRSTTPNILGYYDGTAGTGDLTNGQGWYDLDIDADPKNAEVVYVGGINIWKSVNGGTTWTQVGHWFGGYGADDIHADQHAIDFNITGSKLYSGNDGGVYYTLNAGSRWINISTGIQNSQIYRIAHAKTDEFIGAQGYQDNGSSQTTKDEFYTYYGGDGMDCQVDPTDANYVYGSYVFGRIYRAVDKNSIATVGANGTGGINEGGNWLTPFILQEGQPATMFAGYGNVWRTTAVKTASPPTWTAISTGFGGVRMLENSPARNAMLYALQNNGNIQRTGNVGSASVSWVSLGTGPGGVRWIEAHHKDSNRVYCVNATTLYRSINKGQTWTAVATPAGAGALNMCLIDTSSNTEMVYIGSERGIYVWDSLGNQWVNYNKDFPVWADVTDMDIWYSPRGKSQSKIVASTYGRGVWRSNLYDRGTQIPKSGFYAFDSVLTVGGKTKLYEKISGSVSALVWKISPNNYTYRDRTDSTSYAPSIQFNKKGLYTIRLIATNCQGSDTFTKTAWLKVFDKPTPPQCYNTTTFSSSNSVIGLLRFSLSDNNNETGGYFDDGENLDFSSSKVFRLKTGTGYTVTAKTGPYNSEYLRMFIDYNGDGKFQNYLGEITASSTNTFGTKTLSFTTPATSLKRNTGLRFRLLSDINPIDTNACRNLSRGQGEDYTFVFDQPIPYFKVSQTVTCTGNPITFTDTSEGLVNRWEWDFGSGASPRTATGQGPHQVSYSNPGTKSVRLRVNGLDSLRKNAYITVNTSPNPIVLVKSGINPGCQGRSVTLVLRNRNFLPTTFQWQKNGINLPGKTDSLLVLNNVSLADTGVYTGVLVSGAGCRATSNALKLVVYSNPSVSFIANNSNQCLKANRFVFTNQSTSADGNLTYQWAFGDGKGSLQKSPVYSYATAGPFNVKLLATTIYGCTDSVINGINVLPQATPAFTVNDSDQCEKNNTFAFSNKTTISSGTLNYLWNFGDGSTSSAVHPVKSFSAFGTYKVSLFSVSDKGCKDTIHKFMRVYAMPKAAFTVNPIQSCLLGNRFVSSNKGSISEGSFTVSWRNGDGSMLINSSNNSYSYSAAGTYKIWQKLTSNFGCVDSGAADVTVHPMPNVAFTMSPPQVCEGERTFANNNSTISSGSLQYTWGLGRIIVKVGDTFSVAFPLHGSYTIRLIANSNKGCSDTSEGVMVAASVPVANFTALPNPTCAIQRFVTFTDKSTNADGKPLAQQWDFGDGTTSGLAAPSHTYGTAGNFRAVLTASNGKCTDTAQRIIAVVPAVNADFITGYINKETRSFKALDTLTPGYRYAWSYDDGLLGSGPSTRHMYRENRTFTVKLRVENSLGCADSSTQPVQISSPNYIDQKNGASFYVYPNPNGGVFTYKFSIKEKQTVEVKLYDIIGQLPVYTTSWNNAEPGNYFESVDMKKLQLAKGVYPLVIKVNGQPFVVKVVYVGD
jgi:PKD repeat protein